MATFLADWKSGYRPGMDRVNRGSGRGPRSKRFTGGAWRVLPHYGLEGLGDADLARLPSVVAPAHLPDAVPGLRRLRARFILSPLSNGSFAGMLHLARFAGLPWDCIITAENARCYKPRPEVYRTAVTLLGLRADEVMMVAAHNYDLHAARACGLRTAFVPRQAEHGPGQRSDLGPDARWDIVATDFIDLAGQLET